MWNRWHLFFSGNVCWHLSPKWERERFLCVQAIKKEQSNLRECFPINTCFVTVIICPGKEMMASGKKRKEGKEGTVSPPYSSVCEREELMWDEHIGLFILLIYFQPSGFMVIGKALPTRSFPEGVNISPSPSFLPLCSFFFSFLCVLFSNSIFSPKHHSAFLGRRNAVSLREPIKKKKCRTQSPTSTSILQKLYSGHVSPLLFFPRLTLPSLLWLV